MVVGYVFKPLTVLSWGKYLDQNISYVATPMVLLRLLLTLPKAPEVKPKKITVATNKKEAASKKKEGTTGKK